MNLGYEPRVVNLGLPPLFEPRLATLGCCKRFQVWSNLGTLFFEPPIYHVLPRKKMQWLGGSEVNYCSIHGVDSMVYKVKSMQVKAYD